MSESIFVSKFDPSIRYTVFLIEYSHDNQLCILTINRPKQLNAINDVWCHEFRHFLHSLDTYQNPVRVVIIRGAGRAFCSGADLVASASLHNGEYRLEQQQYLSQCLVKMRQLPQIFIAAIHGPATGAGFSLTLACDVRICTENARMNAAFINFGLSGCECGSSYFLTRAVGSSIANELLLTGRFILASRALATGLVSEVVKDETALITAARRMAEEMLQKSKLGLRLTKEVMETAMQGGTSLASIIQVEDRQQVMCVNSAACREVGAVYAASFIAKAKAAASKQSLDPTISSKL